MSEITILMDGREIVSVKETVSTIDNRSDDKTMHMDVIVDRSHACTGSQATQIETAIQALKDIAGHASKRSAPVGVRINWREK